MASFNLDEFTQKYEVHPETVSFLKSRIADGIIPLSSLTPEQARIGGQTLNIKYAGTTEFDGVVDEIVIPSPFDPDGLPVTLYTSASSDSSKAVPILVYFHGGGHVLGSRKTYDTTCKLISRYSGCIVVSVEYRLAPEHKFPADVDDAKLATEWVLKNKARVGGKKDSKTGVGGDSAGGSLAGTVCHEVNGVDFQVLIYPGVGLTQEFPSYEEFKNGPIIPRDALQWFTKHYIGEKAIPDVRANQILRPSFDNLPPALIIVADLDPLRDGCYALHKKLLESGVKCEVLTVKGTPHGFFSFPGQFKECFSKAIERIASFIQSQM